MRRIELLIAQSRRDTDNTEYSDTTGLSDDDFIQWANDAQERLQGRISDVNPKLFQVTSLISSVASQRDYDLPTDMFMDTKLEKVEFSAGGQEADYDLLPELEYSEILAGEVGRPDGYVRRSGTLILSPAPSTSAGLIRLTYQKRLPKLDKRRGKVSAVVLGADSITSLTIDSTLLTEDDATRMVEVGYICIVTAFGDLQMRRIPITNVDTATGVVTVDPSFTFDTGETITTDDYAVSGIYHTSHPQLPEECERYYILAMNLRALRRDSSGDSSEAKEERDEVESQIVDSYKIADKSIHGVAILDDSYLG